jgi:hypothetical protein
MPTPWRTSVSCAALGTPVEASLAPAAFAEFAQPCPLAPALPHGQGVALPSPKQ